MKERILGLDALRAIAITGVLVSHGSAWLASGAEWGHALTATGAVGVEIFFVLSGFLIGGIILRETQRDGLGLLRAATFLKRRWFRTLPNYFLALVAFIGAATLLSSHLAAHLWTYFVFSQNVFSPPDFMVITWSLTIEEWFYLLLAVGAVATGALARRPARIVWIAIGMLTVSVALRWYAAASWGWSWEATRKTVPLHLDTLAIGVLAAWWAYRAPDSFRAGARAKALAGLAIASGCLLLIAGMKADDASLPDVSPAFAALWFVAFGVGVALCLPALTAWRTGAGPHAWLIERISLYSYSLYLWHPMVRGGFDRVHLPLPGPALWLVWAIAATVFSAAIYHAFEKPLMDRRDRPLWPATWRLRRGTGHKVPEE